MERTEKHKKWATTDTIWRLRKNDEEGDNEDDDDDGGGEEEEPSERRHSKVSNAISIRVVGRIYKKSYIEINDILFWNIWTDENERNVSEQRVRRPP